MTVYEIVSLNQELLKRLHGFGISIDDFRWVNLYRDYLKMKAKGDKMVYIAAMLSRKYGVCERKVYKVINKMKRDCHIDTTE